MKKLRILFLCPVPSFKGGAERSLLDLLSNPDIQPLLVVPEEGAISRWAAEHEIPVEILDFRGISNIQRPFSFMAGTRALRDLYRTSLALVDICRTAGVDIVHSNGLKAHFINVVARKLGGPPSVVHLRDIANTRSERLTWSLLRRLADHVVLVSRATWFESSLPSNVSVIHNGFKVAEENREAGLAENLTVGFVGRIHPFKGLHLLIEWFAKAIEQGFDGRLSVRGSFASETPDYEDQIKNAVETFGLQDRVSFEGFVPEPERVYAGLDLIVVPSIVPEPFARSVLEAMGRGLTVIGYPSGGTAEMISSPDVGFLVDSAPGFTKVLLMLDADRTKMRSIGETARTFCKDNFSVERLHSQVTQLYYRLLQQ